MKRLLAFVLAFLSSPVLAQGDFVASYRGLVVGRSTLTNGFVTLRRSEHAYYLAIESSPSQSADWTLRWPTGPGVTGQCLQTTTSGSVATASWGTCYTLSGALLTANNLSELTATAATARTNLGLGTLATQSGTFSGTSSGTNTGDQTITLTGGVTGSGTGSFPATVVTNANLTGPITSVGNATTVADGELAALAGLTSAADRLPYFSGSGTAGLVNFSSANRSALSALSGTNTGDQTTITGNAGTATALAANGANCGAGNYARGVDASGAAEDCTAAGGFTIGDTQVAFADGANTPAGDAGMTYSKTTDTLTLVTAVTTPTHKSAAGAAVAVTATAPTAANGASQAGVAASVTASAATASLDTAGAAAGGDANITAGAAARLTSGNAAGGNVILLPGAGIGTGVAGQVKVRQGGTITAPALTVNASGGGDDSGWYNRTTDTISFTTASVHRGEFTAAGQFVMMSDKAIGWFSATTPTGAGGADTGLNRHSAGVIRASLGGSEINGFMGGGAAVASATALPLPTGRVFHVTGTTTITSITSTNFGSGAVITLIFDGVLTFTDGGNLMLAGNFVTAANGTITLVFDGTSWFEIARSVN